MARRDAAGQNAFLACGAEDDAGAGACRARDLMPEGIERGVVHPVLRVEQHVAVEAVGRFVRQEADHVVVDDVDAVGAGFDGHEIRFVEIGRAGAFALCRVAPAERLPGEIVVFEIEARRQALGALFQNIGHRARAAVRQRIVLCRRDAETEEGGAVGCDPAQERMIEGGRDFAVEDFALFFDGARFKNPFRICAEDASCQMSGGDEASEQSVAIEVARKSRDAAAARQIAAFPIAARIRVEVRGDEIVIEMDVAVIVGCAEKAKNVAWFGRCWAAAIFSFSSAMCVSLRSIA